MDLLPPKALVAVARVLTYGAKKYSVGNWRNVDNMDRYVAATLRHIVAYMTGEKRDPETGEHHLSHALCCLMFIVDLEDTESK